MEISTISHILVWLVSNSYRVSRVTCQYQLRKRNWRQKYTSTEKVPQPCQNIKEVVKTFTNVF